MIEILKNLNRGDRIAIAIFTLGIILFIKVTIFPARNINHDIPGQLVGKAIVQEKTFLTPQDPLPTITACLDTPDKSCMSFRSNKEVGDLINPQDTIYIWYTEKFNVKTVVTIGVKNKE